MGSMHMMPPKNPHTLFKGKWCFGTHAMPCPVGLWVPILVGGMANAPAQFLGPPTLGGHRATELACQLPKDGKKTPKIIKSQLWQGNAQVAAKKC